MTIKPIPTKAGYEGMSLKIKYPRIVAPTISRYWKGASKLAGAFVVANTIIRCPIIATKPRENRSWSSVQLGLVKYKSPPSGNARINNNIIGLIMSPI